jgi:hypothetical protein
MVRMTPSVKIMSALGIGGGASVGFEDGGAVGLGCDAGVVGVISGLAGDDEVKVQAVMEMMRNETTVLRTRFMVLSFWL